jgi:hypothetical protein
MAWRKKVNAKRYNRSIRLLYLNGGRLDLLLYGLQESQRQFDEQDKMDMKAFGFVKECPCGCGLKGEICKKQLAKVRAANDEIPF